MKRLNLMEHLTQYEAFQKCKREGKFIFEEDVDIVNIISKVNIASADLESANSLKKNLAKDSIGWNSVYKLAYDALHELVKLYLQFDQVRIDNPQCMFVYLCEIHPELEFNLEFFEKIHVKRNDISSGKPINYSDWKEAETKIILYASKLRREIEKKTAG